jgi:inosose dehydratase
MRDIGLPATELGSDGFLPATPEGKAETLNRYALHGLGNFTAVVLHDSQRDPRSELTGCSTVSRQAASGFEPRHAITIERR